MATTDPAPQFGAPEPGREHRDRPTAFAVAERDGRIAVVHITRADGTYVDLPGGALDPGEDEAEALVREWGEETGLRIEPARRLGRGDQYMLKVDGEPVNNRAALFEARITGEDAALKIEDDHELRWLSPQEAIAALRHPMHAWAVALWLRARREDAEGPRVRAPA
ncbi:MAG: NUDIX domain-containing protein [Caulobacteraceae bacterium]|nr:NUDIX domain-containing protein [Caulobacter sp.]